MNEEKLAKIKEIFLKSGLPVGKENQFLRYFTMLVETNKEMNLTAITEFEDVIRKHFVDSLMILSDRVGLKDIKKMFASDEGSGEEKTGRLKLIDVGTGAGFPGVPLKIMCPQINLTLLDALDKRLRFLDEVCLSLDLENVSPVHGRTEDMGHDGNLREQFDIAVSRAVSNLTTLSEYCLPFVKTGGVLLAYKGDQADQEMADAKKAIEVLGGEIENVEKFKLPGGDEERALIVIRKKKATPEKYPRSPKKIKNEPIK